MERGYATRIAKSNVTDFVFFTRVVLRACVCMCVCLVRPPLSSLPFCRLLFHCLPVQYTIVSIFPYFPSRPVCLFQTAVCSYIRTYGRTDVVHVYVRTYVLLQYLCHYTVDHTVDRKGTERMGNQCTSEYVSVS
jgi:hypothetical protein